MPRGPMSGAESAERRKIRKRKSARPGLKEMQEGKQGIDAEKKGQGKQGKCGRLRCVGRKEQNREEKEKDEDGGEAADEKRKRTDRRNRAWTGTGPCMCRVSFHGMPPYGCGKQESSAFPEEDRKMSVRIWETVRFVHPVRFTG